MKTFTVWISKSDDLDELLEIDNDILRYDSLTWDQAMQLFSLSLDQGLTCIMVKEEPEA